MPVTFAFQSIAEVSGAGPGEKREKDESPMNWGHSYWSRLEFDEVGGELVCAPTMFWFDCSVKMAETDETSNNAKIIVTFALTCVNSLPPRMND
jgi:hypothetical protein